MGGKEPKMRILCHKKSKAIFEEEWNEWCWDYSPHRIIQYDIPRKRGPGITAVCCSGKE